MHLTSLISNNGIGYKPLYRLLYRGLLYNISVDSRNILISYSKKRDFEIYREYIDIPKKGVYCYERST